VSEATPLKVEDAPLRNSKVSTKQEIFFSLLRLSGKLWKKRTIGITEVTLNGLMKQRDEAIATCSFSNHPPLEKNSIAS
jgi:hypothetical protein